jgi:cob(I)alamin adenosyltransferase
LRENRERTVGIVTKTGDKGETSLCYGGRVPKNSPRLEAYGTADEAISALGLARALSKKDRVKEIVLSLQRELSTVIVELATDRDYYDRIDSKNLVVTAEMVERLDGLVDELEQVVDLPKGFIVPGACPASAALDLARTIIRRVERRVVGLHRDKMIENENLLAYVNRASDLVFMLARYEEAE